MADNLRNAQIKLGVWRHGGWTRWTVTFANPQQVLDYINRKLAFNRAPENDMNFSEHYGFEEIETEDEYYNKVRELVPFGPVEETVLAILKILYPQCHHMMDLSMCMDPYGPHHWGTREQELAGLL